MVPDLYPHFYANFWLPRSRLKSLTMPDGLKPKQKCQTMKILPIILGLSLTASTIFADELLPQTFRSDAKPGNWGIQVNSPYEVAGLLFGVATKYSGTVSNFSLIRAVEIAIPFQYEHVDNAPAFETIPYGSKSSEYHVDCQLRYFFLPEGFRDHLYIGSVVRYQRANYLSNNPEPNNTGGEFELKKLNRLGFGLVLGMRFFSRSGFYYGCNVSLGNFLGGDTHSAGYMPSVRSGSSLTDYELLNIGYSF